MDRCTAAPCGCRVANPRSTLIPGVNRRAAFAYGAVSAHTWILAARDLTLQGASQLSETHSDIALLGARSREIVGLERRWFAYSYTFSEITSTMSGTTSYRIPVLGTAHLGTAAGRWFFVPMDRPVIELHDAGGGGPPVEIALPLDTRSPLGPRLSEYGDSVVASVDREYRAKLRAVYDGVERAAAGKTAAPVQRVVTMGDDIWVNPCEPEPGTEGKTVWFVASAREKRCVQRLRSNPTGHCSAAMPTSPCCCTARSWGKRALRCMRSCAAPRESDSTGRCPAHVLQSATGKCHVTYE